MNDKNRFPYDSYGLANKQRLTEKFTAQVSGVSSPRYANHIPVTSISSTEHFTNNLKPQRYNQSRNQSRNQSSANIEYFTTRNDYTHRIVEHYDDESNKEGGDTQDVNKTNNTFITVEHPNIKNINKTPSMTNNILYQTMWSNLAGEFDKEDLSNIKILKKNTPQNAFNCSGDIRIRANVPDSKNVKPNYMEAFLSADIPKNNTFYKFKSLIQSADFMADLSESIAGEKQAVTMPKSRDIVYTEVPRDKSLRQLLNESIANGRPWHTWYLMYGRNYNSQNEVKNTLTFMINKVNELIHHIIDNDITKPNDEVRRLVKAIFAKDNGQVYSYARNTFLLPAILNALAVRNNNDQHCMNGVGWIKAGSQLLPGLDDGSTDTSGVLMRNLKGQKMNAMQSAPFIIQTNLPTTVGVSQYNTVEGFSFLDMLKATRAKTKEKPGEGFSFLDMLKATRAKTKEKPGEQGEYVEKRHTVAEASDKYKQLITVAPYNYPLTYLNVNNPGDKIMHDVKITEEDIKDYQFPESIQVGCFQKYKLDDGTEHNGFLAEGGVIDPYAYIPVDESMEIATVEYETTPITDNSIERGARALTFAEFEETDEESQKPTCLKVADGPPGNGKEVKFDISGDYTSARAVYDKGGSTISGKIDKK